MKTAGIIAEYNPFHNGHAYQIRQLKDKYHYDYVVAAISGDFVQRGAPAIMDKYSRARAALLSGADLVLELPSLFAVSSAEFFASAGVSLFGKLGCIDTLCFGLEADMSPLLSWLTDFLLLEPETYRQNLTEALKTGIPFPAARMKALAMEKTLPVSEEELAAFLTAPNNILALEYEKAIKKYAPGSTPLPIRRIGNSYHSTELLGEYCSATALRAYLTGQTTTSSDDISESLPVFVPGEALKVLSDYSDQFSYMTADDFSLLLQYRILSCEDFSVFPDCSKDLSNKIKHYRRSALSFSAMAQSLHSKDLTLSRISRVLLHILLDQKKDKFLHYTGAGFTPYARILGFCRTASPLLSSIKECSSIPLISKAADAENILKPDAYQLFLSDVHASDIYHMVMASKCGHAPDNDYTHRLEII